MPQIELASPQLFTIAGLPVTSTILTAWIVSVVVIVVSLVATRDMKLVPSGLQNAYEMLVEGLLGIATQTADERRARRFFPLIAAFFMFILFSNWLGVLPLFGEGEFFLLGPGEGGAAARLNILRSANSDLNVTGAMALIVFVWTEFLGLRSGGLAYLKEFIWPGLLIEIISHVARSVALALRLFGNILAGEILLGIMSALVPLLIPALFMGFELFVGLVQALIFTLLTLAFMTLATEHEAAHHAVEREPAHH